MNVQDARSHFQRLELGYNGSGVIPNIGDRYGYFGGVAVKVSADSNDWIGAYTPTGG